MDHVLRPWRSGRLWPSLVHAVLDLPIGVGAFVPAAALSAITLGGAPVVPLAVVSLALLLTWSHLVGTVERSRSAALLAARLPNPVPPLPEGSPWAKLKAAVTTRARWNQVAHCLLRLPVGVVVFTVVVGSWAVSLAALGLPAYVAALPRGTAQLGLFGISQGPSAWAAALLGAVGLAAVAPFLTLVGARVDLALATWLLGPPPGSELAARAQRAETGGAAAVDSAEYERRRIERDLHDGAQQRLVALAMDLGSARERLESDPEGGKALRSPGQRRPPRLGHPSAGGHRALGRPLGRPTTVARPPWPPPPPVPSPPPRSTAGATPPCGPSTP